MSTLQTKKKQPLHLEVLDQEVDEIGPAPSHYRILQDYKHSKYISIDFGVYDSDVLRFPPDLLDALPIFPPGDWNSGHITTTASEPNPHFSLIERKELPSINTTWHPTYCDFASLEIGERLMSNILLTTFEHQTVIVKYASFDWEIDYYEVETQVYSWLQGYSIGPKFLGHLTEEGRVIGFLLEKVEGRHATIKDLGTCTEVVKKLHSLDILHGDLNKYNFIIAHQQAVLIDYETAEQCTDDEAKRRELQGLEGEPLDESERRGLIESDERISHFTALKV